MGQVVLVRHGQASFGADDYDVLSETGWEQGRALGRWLGSRGETPGAVVRGGLRRHRETFEAVADGAGWGASVGEPEVDERWDEIDVTAVFAAASEHGPLDRRTFQAHYAASMLRWTEGHDDGLMSETWPDFHGRVLATLEDAVGRDGTTLVVTSGGPVGAVVAALLAGDEGDRDPIVVAAVYRRVVTTVVNTSVTRVVSGRSGVNLLTYNEHGHLERDLVTYR